MIQFLIIDFKVLFKSSENWILVIAIVRQIVKMQIYFLIFGKIEKLLLGMI